MTELQLSDCVPPDVQHDVEQLNLHRPRVWRVGRKVGRTVYIQNGDEPGMYDRLVGLMDSRDLAQLVVDSVNHFYSIDPDHPCPAVVAVNDFYGRDVIPEDHGPVLPPPAQTDLPVVPLDPLGDNTCATDE